MIKLVQPKFWYKRGVISYLLLPFSFICILLIKLRRFYYKHLRHQKKFSVPIIVVGNITVGGTGKTPLAIYLANMLKEKGYNPGIISRGYGRKSNRTVSIIVISESDVDDVGDEALLILHRTKCPVIVDIDRAAAAKKLIDVYGCDVIVSDDGLQHYRLPRYLEIAIFDSEIGFGNGFCLPAGPLREPISRLEKVDFVVENFNTNISSRVFSRKMSMVLEPTVFRNVKDPALIKNVSDFRGQVLHAVAGIGRPRKFFDALHQLGLEIVEHPFPDHHRFCASDFPFREKIVIMTEKDAIKCGTIAESDFWYLEIDAKPSREFVCELLNRLDQYN